MKKIMFVVCWMLYGIGHLISVTTMRVSWLGFTYYAYNKFMGWSFIINEKYDLDVWVEQPIN